MTIANGNGDFGGGIKNAGTLTLTNAVMTGNRTSSTGGAIQNIGQLNIVGSTFSGNRAPFGGAISSTTEGSFTATATLIDSTLSGNSATNAGSAIYDINLGDRDI